MKLTREMIDACFEQATEQADYIIALHKLVIPEWDEVEAVEGHPSCSDATWKYICTKAMAFDQVHHDSLPGGAWMNWGFSTADVSDWYVSLATCTITMKAVAVPA